ncbi:MAG: diguanylate cyclase [Chloroflexi bacterium]|nr:diguanylate cyclase [Chloroflexota bacterium]
MNFRFSWRDLLVPRRLAFILAGLILLLGIVSGFSLPAVTKLGQQALAFVLLAGGYLITVYALSRIYQLQWLRYITSTGGVLLITAFFFTLREEIPAIFLFYLFAILTDSLFWGQNTAFYTSILATLGYATVTFLNPDFLPRDALNIGLVAVTFLATSFLAGGLVREERARTREMAVLSSLATVMTESRDLTSILKIALDEVMRVTGFENGGIALVEETHQRLILKVHRGFSEALVQSFQEPADKHPMRWKAINAGENIFAENLAYYTGPMGVEVLSEKYRSAAFIPLKEKDQVVGLLGLGSRRRQAFSQEDKDLLSTVGHHLGLAVANARLYEETFRQIKEIQSLRTMGEVVIKDLAEGVLIEDAQGLITYANPRVEEMLGYIPGELVGRHWRELVPADYLPIVEKEYAKRPKGVSSRYESMLLGKGGRRIPVIISSRPLFEKNEFSGVLVVLTDITERKRAEESLQEANQTLQAVIETSPVAIITLDPKGIVKSWNKSAEEMFGWKEEEVVGKLLPTVSPEKQEEFRQNRERVLQGEAFSNMEVVRQKKDGTPIHVSLSTAPLRDAQGNITELMAVLVDITDRKKAEEETKRHLEEFSTMNRVAMAAATALSVDEALEGTIKALAETLRYHSVAVLLLDAETKTLRLHPSRYSESKEIFDGFTTTLGKGITGWVAQSGEPILVPDVSKDKRYIKGISETRSEICAPLRVGNKVIGVLNVESPTLNAFSEHDLSLLTTIASQVAVLIENARLYEETKQLSITDTLTGLYNLRYFYQELGKEIGRSDRYQRPLSLIMFDIDNFKKYNDNYGHLAGDDLLKELARLASELIRRTDTLARYGGEEFFIILPETAPEEASRLAGRIVEAVRKYRFLVRDGTRRGQVTVSCGVATYPLHADNPKALIQAADAALYKAKETKDRIWTYTPAAGIPPRKPEPAVQRRTSAKPSK